MRQTVAVDSSARPVPNHDTQHDRCERLTVAPTIAANSGKRSNIARGVQYDRLARRLLELRLAPEAELLEFVRVRFAALAARAGRDARRPLPAHGRPAQISDVRCRVRSSTFA